jgi:nitrite reductase/ring-hydroxylating ferredoxin subunit
MCMSGLVRLTSLDELPPGSAAEFEHGGRVIAVFHLESGEIRALDGLCAHQGGPIARGAVDPEGGVVSCPWHGWPYRLGDGQSLVAGNVRLETYEVHVVGRDILVALS